MCPHLTRQSHLQKGPILTIIISFVLNSTRKRHLTVCSSITHQTWQYSITLTFALCKRHYTHRVCQHQLQDVFCISNAFLKICCFFIFSVKSKVFDKSISTTIFKSILYSIHCQKVSFTTLIIHCTADAVSKSAFYTTVDTIQKSEK